MMHAQDKETIRNTVKLSGYLTHGVTTPSHTLTAILQNSGLTPLRRASLIKYNAVLPFVAANTPLSGILVAPVKATELGITLHGWLVERIPTDHASTLDMR